MLKAALAVIAGFVSVGGVAVGLDAGFERLFPDQYGPQGEVRSLAMLLFILLYTLLSCLFGGWITAAIARQKAMGASMALAALVMLMTIVNLTLIPNQLPVWWRLVCLILSGPAVVLGGWLRTRGRRSPVGSVA